MSGRRAWVIEAELHLEPGADERAPGGVVTAALCGHWEHEGLCRWPHHSRIDTAVSPVRLRTVVVTDDEARDDVAGRVEDALHRDGRWSLLGCHSGEVTEDERPVARALAEGS